MSQTAQLIKHPRVAMDGETTEANAIIIDVLPGKERLRTKPLAWSGRKRRLFCAMPFNRIRCSERASQLKCFSRMHEMQYVTISTTSIL